MRRIVLDISRILSRAAQAVPTGIDRVELAYAEALIARMPERLDFLAVHPFGPWAKLPHGLACRFVAAIAHRWRTPDADDRPARLLARRLRGSLLLRSRLPWRPPPSTYLLTSHHHLDRPEVVVEIRRRCGRLACFIHDLIPIQFPEYARPNEPARHARRMRTAALLSDQVICNSADTARAFEACLREAGRAPPVLVALLGVDLPPPTRATDPVDDRPLFVCVGTIEPRKNHLLLLQVWRQIAKDHGAHAPRLVLVGRRGWENENVIDLIERCEALQGVVEERNVLSDSGLSGLLSRARALLIPTFAEGFGLPLAEALAAGVPALCSDVAALREVGASAPEYLDPLDGPGWMRAIMDYADPDSSRRAAQLDRLRDWRLPSWADHMDAVLALLDSDLAQGLSGQGEPVIAP